MMMMMMYVCIIWTEKAYGCAQSVSHADPINPVNTLTFVCHVCHHPCKSSAGLQSHLRTHEGLFDAEHET